MTLVSASHLKKTFGSKIAVNDVELSIAPGEIYGLVGSDGAGKTTTLRLLVGALKADAGDISICGYNVRKQGEQARSCIGYLSQRFSLYEDLSVLENIRFFAELRGMRREEWLPRCMEILEFVGLAGFKDRRAGQLSGGMKQKLGLACALIHTPEVLLLDEPTNGVDPVSRRDFWRILYDLLKEGVTILVSTAYLDEAERCTQVGLIHKGRLMMKDSPMGIKKSLGLPMIELWSDDARNAREIIREVEGVKGVSIYGDRLHITIEKKETAGIIVEKLRKEGIAVKEQREILPSIEDIFISMVQGK